LNWLNDFVLWNPPLALAIVALVSVQVIKFTVSILVTREIDVRRLIGTGGMPSSHAASVAALATTVGLDEGWNSTIFGIATFFSLVVIYDAAGIRRAAGKQASVLNRMIDDLKAHHVIEGERLIELLGHTPLEVLTGTAYGIALALALHP